MEHNPVNSRPPAQVFISHSNKDKKWLERLQIHLKPLARDGMVVWDDTQIQPGADWQEETGAALAAAGQPSCSRRRREGHEPERALRSPARTQRSLENLGQAGQDIGGHVGNAPLLNLSSSCMIREVVVEAPAGRAEVAQRIPARGMSTAPEVDTVNLRARGQGDDGRLKRA